MGEIRTEQITATIAKSQRTRKYIEDIIKLVGMMSVAAGLMKGIDRPIEAKILAIVIAIAAWAYFSLLGLEFMSVYLGKTIPYMAEKGKGTQLLYAAGSALLFMGVFQGIVEAIKMIAKGFGLG